MDNIEKAICAKQNETIPRSGKSTTRARVITHLAKFAMPSMMTLSRKNTNAWANTHSCSDKSSIEPLAAKAKTANG